MSGSEAGESSKNKRPKNTKFKQQQLPAWQPILTAGTVLPVFFCIGVAFIPLGIGILVASNNVQEKVIDYTQCVSDTGLKCASSISTNITIPCSCRVNFTLDADFKGDVYLYYGLTNYYQNHRRYVKSRDDNQLHGENVDSLISDCEPYRKVKGEQIAPCGAIANSLFNDSFNVFYAGGSTDEKLPVKKTGIAWSTDKNDKFKNPPHTGNVSSAFAGKAKPVFWTKPVYDLDPEDPSNNGYVNEDLIVWMRTAALPSFRKLYRRVVHDIAPFKDGLKKGAYYLIINYAYPVTSFDGTKSFILTTTSWMGGKNPFLGIAYIVVGSLCIVLGVIFLLIHIKKGKSRQHNILTADH